MRGQLEKEEGGGRTNTLFKTEIVLRVFGVEVGRPACAGRAYWHLETVDRSRALLTYQEFRESELRDATECSSLNRSTDSPYIVSTLVTVIPVPSPHRAERTQSVCLLLRNSEAEMNRS
jgi:hypothetical protein